MRLPNDAIERVQEGFEGVDLGDPRRTRRLARVVGKLAERPGVSLPEAMGDEAELEGLYRLANNPHVRFEALNEAQAAGTAERCRASAQVLVIHDTTTASFAHADPNEVGYLSTGKAGFHLHVSLAVDARQWRRPLGVLNAEPGFRAKRSGRGSRKRKVSGSETAHWKDRESERWWRGIKQSAERLEGVSHIHLADREGDSYGLLGEMKRAGLRFVIRNTYNRKARDPAKADDDWSTLRVLVESTTGVLEREVELSTRRSSSRPRDKTAYPPRKGRIARLRFSAKTAELCRPRYLKDLPETIVVNVVHVVENEPPEGEVGVEWTLFTTEPIDTVEQVAQVVDWYRTRWLIEEFNKALKTGCLYEQRQFESRHALLVLLAMSLPIACELLWLRSRARTDPDAPATEVLTPVQVAILRQVVRRKLPDQPTVHQAFLAIAALGGHQRNNGDPGWLILHRGLRKLLAYEVGWRARGALMQRGSAPPTCDQS